MKQFALKRWLPSEEQEQMAIFEWARMAEAKRPVLTLLHASMNGILTDARFGAKLKRLGRKAGCPDMFLPVPQRDADGHIICPGLWIELKRVKGGVLSPEQKEWHEMLRKQRYRVEVCRGARHAIAVLEDYLRR